MTAISSNATGAPAVLELLRQQVDLYRKLSTLSQRQREYVQAGDAENLLGLLAARQKVIDELLTNNSRLAPYRQQWKQVYNALDAAAQTEVNQLVAQVESLLGTILSQDEEDRKKLEVSRNQVSGQLQHTGRSVQAMHAYRSAPRAAAVAAVGPRYTNQKG